MKIGLVHGVWIYEKALYKYPYVVPDMNVYICIYKNQIYIRRSAEEELEMIVINAATPWAIQATS